jgi:RNA polymerase sigma-70 factor (ECF subfamily)
MMGHGVAILTGDSIELTSRAPSDAALAAAGDQHAFERLYRAHVSRILGLARRMSGSQDADELTQEVFVRAWQKLGTFRGESAFGTWLHRLAVNVILERRRSRAVQMSRQYDDHESIFERTAAHSASPDLSLDFEAAIERLPNGAREIFVLHDIEGHKHREIAGMLGISSGTSKTQLHRARLLLRTHLTARKELPYDGPMD